MNAGFLEVHSAALVQLILYTLPLYQDVASQRAVVATIRVAVANGTFLKTLAGSLVKLDAAKLSRQVSVACIHLLSPYWSCFAMLLLTLLYTMYTMYIQCERVLLQECFVLLCWTSVVLRQLQAANAKKAVAKLIECQVSCAAGDQAAVCIFCIVSLA